ncbi:MAG: DUF502 domain-containing protein [Chitinophagaceae bacterium]|jgi:uncharacterized membrane protein|nr:DUF502 domain-containing protein [Chitinophagaceae bacterium]
MKGPYFTSRRLFQYFLQGVLVLAPVSITAYIIYNMFTWLDHLIPVYINLSGDPAKPFYLPGIGFLLVMAGILVVGYISSFFVVSRLLSFFDHALEKTPGVKVIYSFVKDFSEAFAGKKRKFQRAVLVSVYQEDVWQVGFITNEDLAQFGMMEYITVYVPNSYAVAGTLFFVKPGRVRLLNDIQAADALKFAISGGVVEVEES